MSTKPSSDWKPGDPIGYIRSEIPEFEIPPYTGERYEALVPDTLDLQERARLAIHALTECTDAAADYQIYFLVRFRTNPPVMQHSAFDPHVQPKFVEAIPLMRMISGSHENMHVERKLMETMLRGQGKDGLCYTPLQGRPWAYDLALWPQHAQDGQFILPFTCGRTLSAMTLLALRDSTPVWRDAVRNLVDGLIDLAIDTGEYAFFWPSALSATRERPLPGVVPTAVEDGESSRVPHGLVHAYRLLGYEPALDLAGKVINYMRLHFYTEDGAFLRTPGNPGSAHFHEHSHGLLTMAEYAQIADDPELLDFVLRSYEYAKQIGNGLIGYFPEFVNSPEWEASEICEVADMIAVALTLSEAGVGDYWDDADRWIRNMFAEGQLLSTDWIYRVPEVGLVNPSPRALLPSAVGPYSTGEHVPERNLGAFAGWPAANDWYVGNGPGTMHCCTGNGAQAIYRIWERILRFEDGKLRVNLLLNRASPWADVDSYVPYQGRVDVKVKQPVDLEMRIPEWASPAEVRCQVNDRDREPAWDGRYAGFGSLVPGEVATLSFPIYERTDVVHIEKQRFTLIRKGNEVVSIDPPGRFCPLYQRQHYRDDRPRWRKATRFVSDEKIDW